MRHKLTILRQTNLHEATVTEEQLAKTKSFKAPILPDCAVHE